ncbi:MAG: hypothetical protein FJ279_08525, partial [Planctomycetes bacterium]|nr:hypothetical protein [Planctomycetota bacterium]
MQGVFDPRKVWAAWLSLCAVLNSLTGAMAQQSTLLFKTDFSGPAPTGLSFKEQEWEVADGVLRAKSREGGWKSVQVGEDSWEVGAVELRFRLLERQPDKGAFATFGVRGLTVRAHGWGEDRVTVACDDGDRRGLPVYFDHAFVTGRWYRLRVEVADHAAQVSVGGQRVVLVPNPPTGKRKGPVILSCWRCAAEFDDIEVVAAGSRAQGNYNYALNSSFEHATNPGLPDYWNETAHGTGIQDARWVTPSGYKDWHDRWCPDAAAAYHGKVALRVTHPLPLWASGGFAVPQGKTLTLSAYMRSAAADLPVKVQVISRLGAKPVAEREFRLTTSWARYELVLPDYAASQLTPGFIPQAEGTFWVDAVQIEEGASASAYSPSPLDEGFKLWGAPPRDETVELMRFGTPRESVLFADVEPECGYAAALSGAPPVVNGRLDDPCWQAAKPLTLKQVYGQPPTERTEVLALFDREHLYLGLRCHETQMNRLVASVKDQKAGGAEFAVFGDDSVEVFLDPGGDGAAYYQLAVSAGGGRFDQRAGREGYNSGWTGKWDWATALLESRWEVELRLPFSTFAPDGSPSVWRVNFCRNHKRTGELLNWSETEGVFHDARRFGYLRFGPGEFPHRVCRLRETALQCVDAARGLYAVCVTLENTSSASLALKLRATIEGVEGGPAQDKQDVIVPPSSGRQPHAVTLGRFKPEAPNCPVALKILSADGASLVTAFADTLPVLPPLDAYFEYDYYTTDDKARLVVVPNMAIPLHSALELELTAPSTQKAVIPASNLGKRAFASFAVGGLEPGTYPLAGRLVKEGATLATCKAELVKRPSAPTEVKVDRLRRIVTLNGKPFFPYGLFLMMLLDEEAIKGYRAQGFDFLCFNPAYWFDQAKCREIVRMAAEHDLWTLLFLHYRPDIRKAEKADEVTARWRDLRSVIGYIWPDESARDLQKERADLAVIKATDPHRLAFPNHNMASFRAWAKTPEGLPGDVVSLDRYPIWPKPGDPRATNEIYTVEKAALMMAKEAQRLHRPVMWFLQSYGFNREPTAREQEWMNYMVVIHGCRGIYYFMNQPRSVEHWERIKSLRDELRALFPALASVEDAPEVSADPRRVAWTLKQHENAYYLITVSRLQRPQQVTFDLSAMNAVGLNA